MNSTHNQYIRIKARYYILKTVMSAGDMEFDVPVDEKETEYLRCWFFPDEYYSLVSLECQRRELFRRIKEKAEAQVAAVIDETPRPRVHIDLYWAEGERERLIEGCRSLTKEEIDKKHSYLESLGNRNPSREELLEEIEDRFIWKENWVRESGQTWANYTLLKRIPSNEEWYFADYSHSVVRLRDLPTETIVKLFRDEKLRPLRIEG